MLIYSLRVLELVVGVGLLIFIHELGHFLAAKYFGITAPVFSLGFGPRLLGFNWRGTDCRLSLVPLGGYVMLPGEIPEEGKTSDPSQLSSRPAWQRIVVFSSGVFMNVVLSLVLFAIALSIGVPFPEAVVGEVVPDSPASKAGLQRGDRVVAIDGRQNPDFEDLFTGIAFTRKGQSVSLTIQRDGVAKDFTVTPAMDKEQGIPTIGIVPASDTLVLDVDPGSPAAKAGILPGDRIQTLDGLPVFDNSDIASYVSARPDTDVAVGLLRDGKQVDKILRMDHGFLLDVGVTPAEPLTVKSVLPDTPASAAGLLPGDRILSVNSAPVFSAQTVSSIITLNPDKPLAWLVKRGDSQHVFRIVAKRSPYRLQPLIGIVWDTTRPAVVATVSPDSPLAVAGLRPGDTIAAVSKTPVASWDEFEALLDNLAYKSSASDVPVALSWNAAGESVTKTVVLKRIPAPRAAGEVGIVLSSFRMKEAKYPLLVAPWVGVQKTVRFVESVYLLARGLGQHRVAPGKALGGPVRIVQIAYRAASVSFTYFLTFLAIIGLNLAVFNFLPVPFLDGGHVTLTLLEKLRGKPLKPRTYEIVSYIGLSLVLLLALVITYNDILRLFVGK